MGIPSLCTVPFLNHLTQTLPICLVSIIYHHVSLLTTPHLIRECLSILQLLNYHYLFISIGTFQAVLYYGKPVEKLNLTMSLIFKI